MQTLVELLLELKTLAASNAPGKLARIRRLFADPRAPAELQVGRHFVARLLTADVDQQLDSLDPEDRKAAVDVAHDVLPRGPALRALRRVFNDPDMKVRAKARTASSTLGHGIARDELRARVADDRRGGEEHTLWAFGLFASDRKRTRRPAVPSTSAALGLPALATPDDVARLVGLDGADDLAPLMRAGTGPGSGYVEFEIAKAKGGARRIAAPRAALRKVQRAILAKILARVPVHDASHGFVAGRSTVTNARPHRGAAIVLKLDLKDFFPTLHYRRVAGIFRSLGYVEDVAAVLAGLTTYRPRLADGAAVWPGMLPQGAPTSPALANLACRRLDRRLAALAAKVGATYTRYADDLTLSFADANPDVKLGRLFWWVELICEQEGFLERPDKRRVLRASQQQRITGLVVNADVHLPRADRKRFRAMLHNCAAHGLASQAQRANQSPSEFAAYLAGYAAYANMVEPTLGAAWLAEVERIVAASGAASDA